MKKQAGLLHDMRQSLYCFHKTCVDKLSENFYDVSTKGKE